MTYAIFLDIIKDD